MRPCLSWLPEAAERGYRSSKDSVRLTRPGLRHLNAEECMPDSELVAPRRFLRRYGWLIAFGLLGACAPRPHATLRRCGGLKSRAASRTRVVEPSQAERYEPIKPLKSAQSKGSIQRLTIPCRNCRGRGGSTRLWGHVRLYQSSCRTACEFEGLLSGALRRNL